MKIKTLIFLFLLTIFSSHTRADTEKIDWDALIPDIASLDKINAFNLVRPFQDGSAFTNLFPPLYSRINVLFSTASERDLIGLFRFKFEFDRVVNETLGMEDVPPAMSYFDKALDEILQRGISEGRFSILGLTSILDQFHDYTFFTTADRFKTWVLTDYLPSQLKAAQTPEKKGDVLIGVRNLFQRLYAKYSKNVMDLHFEYREEFWNWVYSNEFRRSGIGELSGSKVGFQNDTALVIKHSNWVDNPTKYFFAQKLIETSQNPDEILQILKAIKPRHDRTFPRNRIGNYLYPELGIIKTLHLRMPTRIFFAVKKQLPSLVFEGGLKLLLLTADLTKGFFSFFQKDVAAPTEISAREDRDTFWIVCLQGLAKIKTLDPYRVEKYMYDFREISQMSETRRFMFRCSRVVSKLVGNGDGRILAMVK